MKSLAEFLGTAPEMPETSEPRLEDITDSKRFALAVLDSSEFRRYIVNGLLLGSLPAAIICRLMDHGWGKPVERVEVKDTTNAVEDITPEELEDRALRLAEMARSIRLAPMPKESVH